MLGSVSGCVACLVTVVESRGDWSLVPCWPEMLRLPASWLGEGTGHPKPETVALLLLAIDEPEEHLIDCATMLDSNH